MAGFGMARGMPLVGSVPVPGVVLARSALTPIPLEFFPAHPSPRNAKILRRVHPPSDRALGDASRETALEDVEQGWLSDLRALEPNVGSYRSIAVRFAIRQIIGCWKPGLLNDFPCPRPDASVESGEAYSPEPIDAGLPWPEVRPRAPNPATSSAGAWISPTPANVWGSAPNRGRQHPTLPASLRA